MTLRDTQPLKNLAHLKPGDVLFFQTPRVGLTWQDRIGMGLIEFFQALIHKRHGHYNTVHAAVVHSLGANKQTFIYHVADNGLVLSSIRGSAYRESPFWIYRPIEEEEAGFGYHVADFAQRQAQADEKKYWSYKAAIKSLFTFSSYNASKPAEHLQTVANDTICSKFVAQILKFVANVADTDWRKFYPQINSSCTPKALEAALYHNSYYQRFYYAGPTPCESLSRAICGEIRRLQRKIQEAEDNKKDCTVLKAKYEVIARDFSSAAKVIAQGKDEYSKAELLMQHMDTSLNYKRHRYCFWQAKSAKNVTYAMKEIRAAHRNQLADMQRIIYSGNQ